MLRNNSTSVPPLGLARFSGLPERVGSFALISICQSLHVAHKAAVD